MSESKRGVSIRKPSATISWPLDDAVHTDNVIVTAAVNQHPVVSFTAHTGESAANRATEILNNAAASLMGKVQEKVFAARNTPDCTLKMDDGNGGTLEAEGFLVAPHVSQSRGVFDPYYQFNWGSTVIGNLKMDIYATGLTDPDAPLYLGAEIKTEEFTDPNLQERFKKITEALINRWLNRLSAESQSASKEIKLQRHAIQTQANGALDQWYSLLENSDLPREWLGKLGDNPSFNGSFNNEIMVALIGGARDFHEVLSVLMGFFQLVMVPSNDGTQGKLIFLEETLTGKEQELTLPATAHILDGGTSFDILPIQQVLLRGIPELGFETSPAAAGQRYESAVPEGGLVGGFPETADSASGEVLIIEAPYYMRQVLPLSASDDAQNTGELKPNFEELLRRNSTLVQRTKRYKESVIDQMVQDYCKAIYIDRSLGGCMAQIIAPLDLKLWPGNRYHVVNSKGESLFKGFLQEVVHTMSGSRGGNASADTKLSFSHVTYGSFKLPGIE